MKQISKDALLVRACSEYQAYKRALSAYHQRIDEYRKLWRASLADDQARAQQDDLLCSGTWMHSTCENIKADIVDNYPEAVIYPQEPGDRQLADMLNGVVRYILDRREYEKTFMRKLDDEIQCGTSVLEIFWNEDLCRGKGDVDVGYVDIRSFYWDPDVTDIQNGRSVIKEIVRPLEWFALHYPQAAEHMQTDPAWTGRLARLYDEVDGQRFTVESQLLLGATNQDPKAGVLMLEYWYKAPGKNGDVAVHLARIAGGQVLYDSREDFPQGVYMDGEYPFLLTPYFPDAQQAHGHGIIEIFRQTARYIDKLERLQLRNIIESSKQRKLVRDGCGIDMDKLRDMEEEIIPVANPDGCVISLPAAQPLSGAAYTLYSTKISSLKDESGQNLFNRGEGGKGVTAASAIIALQEAGSKRTRMAVKDQYAAHRRLIRMVIQRVMQFYSGDRVFLLRGKQARRMHSDTMVFDANAYLRSDRRLDFDFDIDIEAQIATPANKVYHNETVFQMFNLVLQYGAQPQLLESLVYMLDIPGKEELLDALQTLWLNLQEQQRAQTAQADLAAQQDTLQLMQAFPELFSSEQVSALQSLGIQASDTPAMDPLGRGEG